MLYFHVLVQQLPVWPLTVTSIIRNRCCLLEIRKFYCYCCCCCYYYYQYYYYYYQYYYQYQYHYHYHYFYLSFNDSRPVVYTYYSVGKQYNWATAKREQ